MELHAELVKKEGLHLYFTNGDYLDLSSEHIKTLADEWWNNPEKIPAKIRENNLFKTCEVCPYRGKNVFCSAMKPLLPFLETIDKFRSYDKVTAVYVRNGVIMCVPDTAMQNALQYVVNMSLLEYCENTKQFNRYFHGIMPFMTDEEIIFFIFLNIYWIQKGNKNKIKAEVEQMNFDITNTSRSCVKRLNLLCTSEAFMNAYICTQAAVSLLVTNLRKYLDY